MLSCSPHYTLTHVTSSCGDLRLLPHHHPSPPPPPLLSHVPPVTSPRCSASPVSHSLFTRPWHEGRGVLDMTAVMHLSPHSRSSHLLDLIFDHYAQEDAAATAPGQAREVEEVEVEVEEADAESPTLLSASPSPYASKDRGQASRASPLQLTNHSSHDHGAERGKAVDGDEEEDEEGDEDEDLAPLSSLVRLPLPLQSSLSTELPPLQSPSSSSSTPHSSDSEPPQLISPPPLQPPVLPPMLPSLMAQPPQPSSLPSPAPPPPPPPPPPGLSQGVNGSVGGPLMPYGSRVFPLGPPPPPSPSLPQRMLAVLARAPPPVRITAAGPSSTSPQPTFSTASPLSPAAALVQLSMDSRHCELHSRLKLPCTSACRPVSHSSTVDSRDASSAKRQTTAAAQVNGGADSAQLRAAAQKPRGTQPTDRAAHSGDNGQQQRPSQKRKYRRQGGSDGSSSSSPPSLPARPLSFAASPAPSFASAPASVFSSSASKRPDTNGRASPHVHAQRQSAPPTVTAAALPSAPPAVPAVPLAPADGWQSVFSAPVTPPSSSPVSALRPALPLTSLRRFCARNLLHLSLFDPFFDVAGERPPIAYCFACQSAIPQLSDSGLPPACPTCKTRYHPRCFTQCPRHRCFLCSDEESAHQSSEVLYTCLLCPRSFCFRHASQRPTGFSSLPSITAGAATARLLSSLAGQLVRQRESVRFLSRVAKSQVGVCGACAEELEEEDLWRAMQSKRRRRHMEGEKALRSAVPHASP